MEIGSEWRGWTVAEYLGGGSFGKVYRIEREEFGYKYEAALKVIRIPHTEDEVNAVRHEGMTEDSIDSYFYSVVKGITTELALLSQLSGNSNIVSYEDHSVIKLKDSFGWEIYLRMELVTPLFEHLKGKNVTARDVILMGIDISKALEICEKNNIIHRDIKPDNIFYSRQGTYKLGDFGIARKLDKAAAEMTKVGTFSYMAPEVYKGQPYDHTVDIYSLGLILYQFMNLNRRPFMPPYPDPVSVEDNEEANMKRLSGADMPRPCYADDDLSDIILKACAFDHKDRYQSAAELRADLEKALSKEKEDRIVFSECEEDRTRSIASAMGSSFDGTVTMFGTAIGLGLDPDDSHEKTTSDNYEMSNKSEAEVSAVHDQEEAPAEIGEKESDFDEGNSIIGEQTGESANNSITDDVKIQPVENDNNNLTETSSERAISKDKEQVAAEANEKADKSRKSVLKYFIVLLVLVAAVSGGIAYWYFNHTVPDVVGMSLEEATETIEKAGLTVGKAEKKKEGGFSDEVKQDDILDQSIKNGEKVKRGTVIDLTISKGKEKTVPPIVGKAYSKAKKLTDKRALVLQPEKEAQKKWSETVEKGCIISQDPKKDTIVEAGTPVKITISKGRKPIPVPKVDKDKKGNPIDWQTAEQKIKDAGLVCVKQYDSSSTIKNGYVISQDPKAKSQLYKNDTVTIKISTGPPKKKYSGSQKKKSVGKKKSRKKKDTKVDIPT